MLAESSLSESPRVQKQRERGLDYEYDFIDDSRPLLFLNSGSAPRPTLAASTGAGRRAAVGPVRRSSLPDPARVGGTLLSLALLSDSRRAGGAGGGVQECGSRQLYCMRGSVCVCEAPALRSVCAWSRETAQDNAASPQPCWTRALHVPWLIVIIRAPQGRLGEPPSQGEDSRSNRA